MQDTYKASASKLENADKSRLNHTSNEPRTSLFRQLHLCQSFLHVHTLELCLIQVRLSVN